MANQRQELTALKSLLSRMSSGFMRKMTALNFTCPGSPARPSPTTHTPEEGLEKVVTSPAVESHLREAALKIQVGAVATEQWWRDGYIEIAEHGYQLRPRYHPNWRLSSLKSGKYSHTEDGKLTIVRYYVAVIICFFSYVREIVASNGRDPRTR